MPEVKLVEVGARDGLQNEPQLIATPLKIELINRLSKTGLKNIEVSSFVSAKKIPQLADAQAVLAGIEQQPDINYSVLVPNEHGMQQALANGGENRVDSVAVFTTVSETFCQKNTNCSIAQSLARIERIIRLAKTADSKIIPVRGYISCVLGCPYEGKVKAQQVVAIAEQLIKLGCYEISLGDTIGVGTPKQATELVSLVSAALPVAQIAVHFHNTLGQALANIYAVLEQGVRIIDCSVAGLGGCPYAKGATGNVATEDVLYMLDGMGITTGVSLEQVLAVSDFVANKLNCKVRSHNYGSRY